MNKRRDNFILFKCSANIPPKEAQGTELGNRAKEISVRTYCQSQTSEYVYNIITTDTLASTVDIAQTILDRARIEPYNGIQGRSLLNAINGNADPDAVDSVIVEDDQQRVYFGYTKPPRIRSLITDTHRLTVSAGEDWGELYDLKADPNEMSNLFDAPSHAALRAELFQRLSYRQMELVDTSPMPTMRA